eukprot:TRINITY_DN11_c0_g1_i1.p1 TRINITY_DN11_c0_g1~~TRINITY_DN11_c0_g1_i1.p1  ORF type:complete len:379 (-),score=72.48 TRINITY_DN11_c0_g1_i1:700-1809(-)
MTIDHIFTKLDILTTSYLDGDFSIQLYDDICDILFSFIREDDFEETDVQDYCPENLIQYIKNFKLIFKQQNFDELKNLLNNLYLFINDCISENDPDVYILLNLLEKICLKRFFEFNNISDIIIRYFGNICRNLHKDSEEYLFCCVYPIFNCLLLLERKYMFAIREKTRLENIFTLPKSQYNDRLANFLSARCFAEAYKFTMCKNYLVKLKDNYCKAYLRLIIPYNVISDKYPTKTLVKYHFEEEFDLWDSFLTQVDLGNFLDICKFESLLKLDSSISYLIYWKTMFNLFRRTVEIVGVKRSDKTFIPIEKILKVFNLFDNEFSSVDLIHIISKFNSFKWCYAIIVPMKMVILSNTKGLSSNVPQISNPF